MRIDPAALVAIVGMAVATYGTRAGGVWVMSRVTLSRRVEAWLRGVPGAVLVAIVAPGLLSGGLAGAYGALAAVAVAVRTRSLLPAMVAGVGVVWAARTLFHA